ncbi:MAG: sulfite exporter TauE/SafE family protein [Clostridia bacterium]|nr:sulfite exporter TauE/SafE family protein [Clostridia bacterium]
MTFYSVWAHVICFITSVSSGMGAGGGGLLTLYLSMFSGVSQAAAQGINLLDFAFALAPSAVVNFVRYKPDIRLISFLTFCGTVGCVLGALFSSHVSDDALRKCCGVFLAAVGAVTLIYAAKDR